MPNDSTIVTYFLNTRASIQADFFLSKTNENKFYKTCADLAANHVFAKINHLFADQSIRNTEIIDLTKQLGILSINGNLTFSKSLNISLENFANKTHQKMQINVSIAVFSRYLMSLLFWIN